MTTKLRPLALLFALLALLAPGPLARAQEPTVRDLLKSEGVAPAEGAESAERAAPARPGETPRSAVRAYLEACNAGDYEAAAKFLELPPRARENGPEVARELKVVLDQTLWFDLDALNDEPAGTRDDGLSADRELVGEIEAAGGPVAVVLRRARVGDETNWRFSSATLAELPALYDQYGYGLAGHYLPSWLLERGPLGLGLWQWIGLLGLVLVAGLAAWLFAMVAVLATRPLLRRLRGDGETAATPALGPLRLLIGILAFRAGAYLLHLPLNVRAIATAIESVLTILAFAWVALRIADVGAEVVQSRMLRRGQSGVTTLLPAGRKTVKALIVLVAAIATLNSFGFNVTALLAGLGVGGIAIALAAQKSLENLFGAVTLFGDRPVRVGDFCRFGDRLGTVEEIGMRSTRVRTLDRTVVSIPNAEFSSLQLENFAERDRIWYRPVLGLRYETTPDQLRYILVEIRKLLYAHPKVDSQDARVRFTSFGAYSLDLEVFAYVRMTDFGEYLGVAEDLNLRIMDIVAEAGSGFAFPSQTTYLEKGEGIDRERGRQAEKRVAEWREQGALFLPSFPPEKIREIGDTLDFPPRGAPGANSGRM